MCLIARHLSPCWFHGSASGAITAAATTNHRPLSQQNPYETRVSLAELGRISRHFVVYFAKILTKSSSGTGVVPDSTIAVELRGVHMMGCAYLYMAHVVLQYATDVKNLIIKNLRQRCWEKIRMWPLCNENSVEHTQSYIKIPFWPEIRDS